MNSSIDRLYDIADFFGDDLSVVSTMIRVLGCQESHSKIFLMLQTQNISKIDNFITAGYMLVNCDSCVDGVRAVVLMAHKMTQHGYDDTFNDDKELGGLFL